MVATPTSMTAFCRTGGNILTLEEQSLADFQTRFLSIGPFLVTRVVVFWRGMKRTSRSNFDVEDILTEAWIRLREKDSYWTPERGRYITFAARVLQNLLVDLRDRSFTVEAPSCTAVQRKRYQAMRESGTMNVRDDRRDRRITCALNGCEPLVPERSIDEDENPASEALLSEMSDSRITALIASIGLLSPIEATVIGRRFGLWGHTPQSYEEIASDLLCDYDFVRKVGRSARDKIRRSIKLPE